MWNAGLNDSEVGIKTAGRNINHLRYADDTTLMIESEEELKSLLMKVKEESGKAGLKFNIQKTKIMASGPITSWKIERENVEAVTDFLFLGSKITADSDCSLEIRRHLLLGRKAMTNPNSILKSRDITLPKKNLYSQSYGFSSSHVQIWELDKKKRLSAEEFMLSNCGAGEVSWESLGLQGDKTSQSQKKSIQIFIGRTDVEAEAPILWPPDPKNWLAGKDPDAGKDWR